ncbi:MAG: citrate lyase [Alphaproteobacteria bacterium]|nr:citrate lyase [Alphaproteobacteria bacterium]
MRSLLFVPGDRPDRMDKALSCGADALILDLEDSVLPDAKPAARAAVAAFLAKPRAMPVFVRVNPLGAITDEDLTAIVPHRPDGIVLPKAEGGTSVAELDARLARLGDTNARILPICTETAKAVFALGSYGGVSARLCGLTWGAEDLPAAIGAVTSRLPDGSFTPPYETLRALTLFGAHAAGVAAIETVFPAIKDEAGLSAYAARGRRDGFSGMLAIHPAQVAVINAAFTPSQAERDWACRVVEAFAQNPGAGAIQLDGRMLDAPHLKQAQSILAQA